MNASANCPDPHPLRGKDGLSHFDDYEGIGKANSDDWGRCKKCGRWFWFATDLGGRFEYVGEREMDKELAEKAFLRADLPSLVEIFERYDLPHGPIWELDSARLQLLKSLFPGADDETLVKALAPLSDKNPWSRVRAILQTRLEASRVPASPLPDLSFVMDIECDRNGIEDAFEMPGCLVLYRIEPPYEVIRIGQGGDAVRIMLPGRPRFLARSEDRIFWALPGANGEAVLTLAANGMAHLFPEAPEHYAVMALDEGFWLFVPQNEGAKNWVEIRRPDGVQAAKFLMWRDEKQSGIWYPPPPCRYKGGGFLASGVMDLQGEVVSLSLFDDSFNLVARTEGLSSIGLPISIDKDWTLIQSLSAPYELSAFRREQTKFTRAWSRPCRTFAVFNGNLAVLEPGHLIGIDLNGNTKWSLDSGDALYALAQEGEMLIYGGDQALYVSIADGERIASIPIQMNSGPLDVVQDKMGTIYLRDDRTLWILRGRNLNSIALPLDAELLTTAGEAVLLGDEDSGQYLLVRGDGTIAGAFKAEDTQFSVVGTRAGPYVLEPQRLRISAFQPLS